MDDDSLIDFRSYSISTNNSSWSGLNYILVPMPSYLIPPSPPRRVGRAMSSPENIVSSSGASASPMIPPEPSLRELYRTYRLQKALANQDAFNQTPQLPRSLRERAKTTAQRAWKGTKSMAKKLSPLPAIQEQVELYRAQRAERRCIAVKAQISPPVQLNEEEQAAVTEYENNERAIARFAGSERESAADSSSRVGDLESFSPPSASLGARRHIHLRLWNITDPSGRPGSGEVDGDIDHYQERQQQQQQLSTATSTAMSFACIGEASTSYADDDSLQGENASMLAQYSLPPTPTITDSIRCSYCRDLTGYGDTGLCEICSATYLSSAPDNYRDPTMMVPPLFAGSGSYHIPHDGDRLRPASSVPSLPTIVSPNQSSTSSPSRAVVSSSPSSPRSVLTPSTSASIPSYRSEGRNAELILPSYRDVLLMSPILPQAVTSPMTPLPVYSVRPSATNSCLGHPAFSEQEAEEEEEEEEEEGGEISIATLAPPWMQEIRVTDNDDDNFDYSNNVELSSSRVVQTRIRERLSTLWRDRPRLSSFRHRPSHISSHLDHQQQQQQEQQEQQEQRESSAPDLDHPPSSATSTPLGNYEMLLQRHIDLLERDRELDLLRRSQ